MKNYVSTFLPKSSGVRLWALLGLATAYGATASSAIAHVQSQAGDSKKPQKTHATQTASTNKLKGTVRTSKTGMGVELDYAFASASVDRQGLLQLTLTRRGTGEDATISIQPDAGLRVTQGSLSDAVFSPGASYTLKIQPLTDGLTYLNVFLKSGTQTESLAIAVQLGKDTRLQKSGAIQTTPSGQRVISVPAQ